MTRNNTIPAIALVALLIGVLAWCAASRRAATVPLPHSIGTVSEGYPFAILVKNSVARGAQFCGAQVTLDPVGDTFEVQAITYIFQGKVLARTTFIQVDNTTHKAYEYFSTPVTQNSQIPTTTFQELNLSGFSRDIPEILAIAKTNKLGEFFKMTSPKTRNINLGLGNSESGPSWYLVADAWDEKGPIVDLTMQISAVTGAVLGESLDKGVGR